MSYFSNITQKLGGKGVKNISPLKKVNISALSREANVTPCLKKEGVSDEFWGEKNPPSLINYTPLMSQESDLKGAESFSYTPFTPFTPEDIRYAYEERLSIMMYDGKLSEREAKQYAYLHTLEMYVSALDPPMIQDLQKILNNAQT